MREAVDQLENWPVSIPIGREIPSGVVAAFEAELASQGLCPMLGLFSRKAFRPEVLLHRLQRARRERTKAPLVAQAWQRMAHRKMGEAEACQTPESAWSLITVGPPKQSGAIGPVNLKEELQWRFGRVVNGNGPISRSTDCAIASRSGIVKAEKSPPTTTTARSRHAPKSERC